MGLLHKTKLGYLVWCPGCETHHQLYTDAGPSKPNWQFNGDHDKPTFSPSLLCWTDEVKDDDGTRWPGSRCHSFIRNGQWQFLNDCTHALAGQTVDMEPVRTSQG